MSVPFDEHLMPSVQQPRPFAIESNLLKTDAAPSDRFVYSLHFVPYQPAADAPSKLIPPYKVVDAARMAAVMDEAVRNKVLEQHPNILALAEQIAAGNSADPEPMGPRPQLKRSRRETDAEREALALQRALSATVVTSDPSQVPAEEVLRAAVSTDIGYLFLDRTRLRPTGFALGEHLVAVSLAPGEEVTLEQRTYSKREVSYEELTDREQTFDMELSSTLTNELSEGLEHEQSTTTRNSDSFAFKVSGEIEGIGVDIGPSTASSVDNADRDTARWSVKNSYVASNKVAARNRSQHKITFRVTTETRFESTSRRVFRNPNPFTPIDLHYFKILQRVRMTQERFGVRLCWAPAVKDPGAHLEERLADTKAQIYAQVTAATAGPRPQPPTPPEATVPAPAKIVTRSVNADKWDPILGNQRYDYVVDIDAPNGYAWDGNSGGVSASLSFSFTGARPNGASVTRVMANGTGVKAIVHVGIADQVWVDASGIHHEARGNASFTVGATFMSQATTGGGDAAYQAAYDAWKKADAQWVIADGQAKADAKKKADAQWEATRAAAVARINPLHETLAAMMSKLFPSKYRDDIWEVDLWERIFDWKNASVRMYPSWWKDEPARDPEAAPTSFINASWARLFLPIRPDAEALALRWIFGLTQSGTVPVDLDRHIAGIIKELGDFRKKHFGDEREMPLAAGDPCPTHTEKFICMGQWEELLPTDGTHLEVMQATTTAADDDQRSRLADAARLRLAEATAAEKGNAMRDAVVAAGVKPVSTQLNVHIGEDGAADS